ncbi:Protein of unknown function [Thermobacillus xylanilyticus]|uniref:Secreted protein n=1 Tax=Thermobacillus xylanilyticus TaxID=76633 RepID=A0ABN7RZH9_THEXY|nr:Protein of unknown function [Thermobacillus xylanilyticus]
MYLISFLLYVKSVLSVAKLRIAVFVLVRSGTSLNNAKVFKAAFVAVILSSKLSDSLLQKKQPVLTKVFLKFINILCWISNFT